MDIVHSRLRSPGDVLAAVPYLLGYRPADSVVVLGLRRKKVVFQVRTDLPPEAGARSLAADLATVVTRQNVTAAVVIGYGPPDRVWPVVDPLCPELHRSGIEILEALRVEDGRYWSYMCGSEDCCPSSGTPFDAAVTEIAAAATFAGIRPADSREELVARLAPPIGPARVAARRAASKVEPRVYDLIDSPDPGALAAAGREAVDAAIAAGPGRSDDDLAWLARLLTHTAVRDHAWLRVRGDVAAHVALWTDVVRRVDPGLAAAPATLLAYAAWRHGEGTIASIALERAWQADPSYPMAHLLADAIAGGLAPGAWLDDDGGSGERVAGLHRRRVRRRTTRRRVPTRPDSG